METRDRRSVEKQTGREVHQVSGENFVVSWQVFNPEKTIQKEEPSQKAIIFIPGWAIGEQTETVRPICEQLAEDLDIQTFAVKSRIERPIKGQLPGSAEAIRLFIESQNLNDITLIGNSEGGAMAIALAARLQKKNPQVKVNGLILLDPTSIYSQGDTELLELYLRDIATTTTETLKTRRKLTESLTYAASGGKGIVKEFIKSGGFLGFINRAGHDVREMARKSVYLSEIKIPIVIAQGARDVISDPNKTTSDVFPNSPWVKHVTLHEWALHNATFITPGAATEAMSMLQNYNNS